MFKILFLALLLQAVAAAPAIADVNVDDRIAFYRVEGSNTRELWAQIHQFGPPDADTGKRYAAYTKWHVVWTYRFRSNSTGCRLEDIAVSDSTVTTLPQWVNEDRMDASLRSRWDQFVAKLREHEAGHRQNGLLAAQAVRDILANAPPQPDCHALDAQASAAAHDAIRRSNQADRDYDARTEHGVTQGTVL